MTVSEELSKRGLLDGSGWESDFGRDPGRYSRLGQCFPLREDRPRASALEVSHRCRRRTISEMGYTPTDDVIGTLDRGGVHGF